MKILLTKVIINLKYLSLEKWVIIQFLVLVEKLNQEQRHGFMLWAFQVLQDYLAQK